MIGIIFIGNLYVCPYLNIYTQELEKNVTPYEVLFWNRSGEKLTLPQNYRACEVYSEEEQRVVTKLFDFLKYRRWLKGQLKSKKYDKLIILSTLSGMLIFDLLKKYKRRYFFDIRDYSYEHIGLFFAIEKWVIKNSFATSISSPGFRNFLPQYEYIIAHNIQKAELNINHQVQLPKGDAETINIVWNGTMRYFGHQKKIIDRLANDKRFALYYHGTGPELTQYEEYCDLKGVKNVFFTGRYDNTEKAQLLEKADIINNSYWIEKENEIKYAISNRFYDGLVYKIPQLVESKTYKAGICEKYGVGIGINPDEDKFADLLYEWYMGFDRERFTDGCEKLMNIVQNDNRKYEDVIIRFVVS